MKHSRIKYSITTGCIIAALITATACSKETTISDSSEPAVSETSNITESLAETTTTSATEPEKRASFAVTNRYTLTYSDMEGKHFFYEITELTNTGDTFILIDDYRYKGVFEDTFFTNTYHNFMAPNEKGYIWGVWETIGKPTDSGIRIATDTIKCKVVDNESVEKNNYEMSDISFKNTVLDDYTVCGTIKNPTDKKQTVDVYSIFYNKDNQIIAMCGTPDLEIDANSAVPFETGNALLLMPIDKKSIDHYVLFANEDPDSIGLSYSNDTIGATPVPDGFKIPDDSTDATIMESNNSGYGQTIVFDNLELTFGKKVKFVTLKNRFSKYNGKKVVQLPITIKNIGEKKGTLNYFYVHVFGTKGTELNLLDAYFRKNSLLYSKDLRPGAKQKVYIYFLYDGKGTYYVNLDNWIDEVELGFEIKK